MANPKDQWFDVQTSAAPLQLSVTTLGGQEILVGDLTENSTLGECLQKVSVALRCPSFTIKLLVDMEELAGTSRCLGDLGLRTPSASAVVVRTPGTDEDYHKLCDELAYAIRDGAIAEAKRLIDLGAGFDAEGRLVKRSCNTMLHLAVREGLTELAMHLISLGVDINEKNDCGRPALSQATIRGLVPVVVALLEARADATMKDSINRTAFSYALSKNRDDLAAKIFAASSLEAEIGTAAQLGPLGVVCCSRGMTETANALREAGADVPETCQAVPETCQAVPETCQAPQGQCGIT